MGICKLVSGKGNLKTKKDGTNLVDPCREASDATYKLSKLVGSTAQPVQLVSTINQMLDSGKWNIKLFHNFRIESPALLFRLRFIDLGIFNGSIFLLCRYPNSENKFSFFVAAKFFFGRMEIFAPREVCMNETVSSDPLEPVPSQPVEKKSRRLLRTALLFAGSAAFGGLAVALWDRKVLMALRAKVGEPMPAQLEEEND